MVQAWSPGEVLRQGGPAQVLHLQPGERLDRDFLLRFRTTGEGVRAALVDIGGSVPAFLPMRGEPESTESPLTRGPLLRRDQIPAPAMLAQLNQRLTAWAEKRTNVIVVPIAKLLARAASASYPRAR